MKRILFVLALLCLVSRMEAKVVLSPIFNDNMVLQQNENVLLHGTATPGKTVSIQTGWNYAPFQAVADSAGKWSIRVKTPSAGGPYTISFDDGEKTSISNVLIGEVWLCSGQSNMEMVMRGYESQPVEHSAERIAGAKPSKPIRICTVPHVSSTTPLETAEIKWLEHTPEAVSGASATAYFFAETLQNALDIPVGIIINCWGGSSIETWMTKEVLESVAPGEFDYGHLGSSDKKYQWNNQLAQLLYNGKMVPVSPFTVKGFIWYQGETNRDRAEQYARLQPAFVGMLRERFQCPDAAFYYVQIAPYPYDNADSWALGYLREAQQKNLESIPHSGMATTTDIGEYQTIHPRKKLEVGQRLAWLALTKDYGIKGLDADAPKYKSMRVDGKQIIVDFDCYTNCICPISSEIEGFEIAGEDRVFHKAHAFRCGRESVRVFCEKVPNPVAVRYCFRNFQEGTMGNTFGIPVGPFRTDDWKL